MTGLKKDFTSAVLYAWAYKAHYNDDGSVTVYAPFWDLNTKKTYNCNVQKMNGKVSIVEVGPHSPVGPSWMIWI